jgi:hypothetical protein
VSRHGLALRLSFLLKNDTTASLYEAVGTPFQAMIILLFNVFWFVVVLSVECRILYVETLVQLSCYQMKVTTIAVSRSLSKPVQCYV